MVPEGLSFVSTGTIPCGRKTAECDSAIQQTACLRYVHGVPRRAFSLIEIMVTVALLSFIILGLLAMFTQIQRAFRQSITQTDVLEAGRSVMELMTREIEQASPTHYPGPDLWGISFFTEFFHTNLANPLIQGLPGVSVPRPTRKNLVQRFFFLSHVNQDWIATGYQVLFDDPNGYVGTLYRFSMTNPFRGGPFFAASRVWTNTPGISRIADGVVHLRVRPFAANGFPLYWNPISLSTNALYRTNSAYPAFKALKGTLVLNDALSPDGMGACYFFKDSNPASVELELGLLEPRITQRYKSIPLAAPAADYLSNHVAQVHIFRQRIPLRNTDLSVYP